MERIKQKYGFTDAQVSDIKDIIIKKITKSLPDILGSILPEIIDKVAGQIVDTDDTSITRSISPDEVKAKASKFMKDSYSFIKCELISVFY